MVFLQEIVMVYIYFNIYLLIIEISKMGVSVLSELLRVWRWHDDKSLQSVGYSC